MLKKVALAVLLLSATGAASAQGTSCQPIQFLWWTIDWCPTPPPGQGSGQGSGATPAPEIDPASALSGLTLALGGLAVLRARRFKNPKQ